MPSSQQLSATDIAVLREAVRLGALNERTAARINVGAQELESLVARKLLETSDSNHSWMATTAGRQAISP